MDNSKAARVNKEAKTGQIIEIEQDELNRHLDRVVRGTVEQTLNALLDADEHREHRDVVEHRNTGTLFPC